jgi:hypothetical protein
MNNMFLSHLKTISPEGRDNDTRLFMSKDKIAEATRSKVFKAHAGVDPNKDYATLKNTEDRYYTKVKARKAAMMRRGGADQETVRKSVEDPVGDYGRPEAQIARNRFTSKSIRSREDGKKSPRDPKPMNEDFGMERINKIAGKVKRRGSAILKPKKIGKTVAKAGKRLYNALSTPQSSVDAMITGRNF